MDESANSSSVDSNRDDITRFVFFVVVKVTSRLYNTSSAHCKRQQHVTYTALVSAKRQNKHCAQQLEITAEASVIKIKAINHSEL